MIDAELRAAAARVVEANRACNRTIALGESCTGGLVSGAITAVPGSSAVFLASIVAYANEAKTGLIGVSPDIIETFGAVSTATAWAMVRGLLDRTRADVALSITGVAGPDGGTLRNPVGTVVFGRGARSDDAADFWVQRVRFVQPDRDAVRRQAVLFALGRLMPGDPLAATDEDLVFPAP